MNMQLSKTPIGLDGIPAAETVLSHVDGERGELIIAGERVGDLARKTGFEGVTARLWSGGTGQPIGEAAVRAALGAARERAARLRIYRHHRGLSSRRFARRRGLRAEAGLRTSHPCRRVPVIRRRCSGEGQRPVAPDPPRAMPRHAVEMLGASPTRAKAAAMDAYFVTVCDHGMNASPFTTASLADQADLFAAVTAGYCALTGPLHGGAPEPVLEMLDAIGSTERIKPWVDSALARGERLMGFGHRVYRVRDPRADVLKAAIERLAGDGADLPFAGEVEAYIRSALRIKNPERPLDTNVEFFTAILLDALKIPRQAFTPICRARSAGWTAHPASSRVAAG